MPQETHSAKPKGKKARPFASLFSRSAPVVTELPPKPPPNVEPAVGKSIQKPVQKPVQKPAQKPAQKATPPLEKRQSKLNLFDLFSKPKVEVAYGHHEAATLDALPERSQTPAQFYRRPEKPQPTKPILNRPSSRLNGPIEKAPQPAAPSRPRPPDDWDPPPLFQAYPQAVKHGALQGTNLSTETLLRAQHYRQHALMPNAFGSTTSLPFVREGPEGDQVAHETKKLVASRRFSTLNEAPELVEKIFVLATSGRLCQYAGEGNYDRMPEKVLHLGEKSAAFACDLIPGKHWVVQVVQAANEDGVATINKSRSILSRLRMPSSAARRATTSFLLIFSSAEDMDGWLRAIRKAIDQINGKTTAPGEGRHSRKNTAERVGGEAVPTHRYRVQRPPSMIQSTRTRSSSAQSQPLSHPHSPMEATSMHLPSTKNASTLPTPIDSPQMPYEGGDRSPTVTSRITSTEAPSLTTTAESTSTDQLRLDQLREGSRHSLISVQTSRTSETETGTAATSHSSSDPPSPVEDAFVERIGLPMRRNTGTFKSSFVIPHAPYNTRRLSAQGIPATRSTSQVVHTAYASGAQRYPPLDFSDRFWLTKPSQTSAPVVDGRRSQSSQGNYPQTRTLKAMKSDSPIDEEENVLHSRRDSTVGQLPNLSSRSLSRTEQPRVKPFFRPLPIRPTEPPVEVPNRTSQSFEPRRFSSLPVELPSSTAPSPPELPPPRSRYRLSMVQTAPNPPPSTAPPLLPASRASTRFSVVPSTGAYSAPAAPVQPPRRASTRFSVVPRAVTPDQPVAPAVQPPSRASSRISMVPEMAVLPQEDEAEQSESQISPPKTTTTTTRPRAPSYSLIPSIQPTPTPAPAQPKTLRRPSSMQIRSDPAPFLSARRTNVSYRASSAGYAPPIPVRDPSRVAVRTQMSMPTIMIPGLPPPAPPPSIPLPPPPVMQATT
jgi:hypothetical protein